MRKSKHKILKYLGLNVGDVIIVEDNSYEVREDTCDKECPIFLRHLDSFTNIIRHSETLVLLGICQNLKFNKLEKVKLSESEKKFLSDLEKSTFLKISKIQKIENLDEIYSKKSNKKSNKKVTEQSKRVLKVYFKDNGYVSIDLKEDLKLEGLIDKVVYTRDLLDLDSESK